MTKTVLIISYFFPPVGGAGVQRVTKFVKYLPDFGWQPVVLTVENPSVPLFDESLLGDIPSSVVVHKAKTLEPSYSTKQAVSATSESGGQGFNFKASVKGLLRKIATMLLQPDPQVLWLPAAYRKACKVLSDEPVDAIFASAPPFSSLLLGAMLARKFKLPLVLDFRDEWDISNSVWENKQSGRISLALQKRMQNYALRTAAAVIATTSLSAEALQEKALALKSEAAVRCIYNGYDAADFPAINEGIKRAADRYELSYVGTLWNLTSIAPLVKAVGLLSELRPELASQLRLVVAGRRTAEQESILADIQHLPVELELQGYLDHSESVALIRRSHGLVVLLSDLDLARRVVPGKIFEYFATANSILAIAPEGEVWNLLHDYPLAQCAEPSSPESITDFLISSLEDFSEQVEKAAVGFDASRFERRQLTAELAAILDKGIA